MVQRNKQVSYLTSNLKNLDFTLELPLQFFLPYIS